MTRPLLLHISLATSPHKSKPTFFELLQFKRHLPETLHIESPDVSGENCQKNFGTPKNLLVITKLSFVLAQKHVLFHILVKLNAFRIKLKSVVPEVIQRLCAKFSLN